MSGKILSRTDYKAVKGFNSTSIDVKNIANVTYIIMVKINNRQLTEKLIIIK